MSIDTAAKRSSALDFEEVWQWGIPFPDGTISTSDRQHLIWSYSGIAAIVPPVRLLNLFGWDGALALDAQSALLSLFGYDGALSLESQSAALTLHNKTATLTVEDDE